TYSLSPLIERIDRGEPISAVAVPAFAVDPVVSHEALVSARTRREQRRHGRTHRSLAFAGEVVRERARIHGDATGRPVEIARDVQRQRVARSCGDASGAQIHYSNRFHTNLHAAPGADKRRPGGADVVE